MAKAVEVFLSYSHKDDALRERLTISLKMLERQGIIETWHDRRITGGLEWKEAIDSHLGTSNLILLLISPDFLASDYCFDIEMKRALERHEKRGRQWLSRLSSVPATGSTARSLNFRLCLVTEKL